MILNTAPKDPAVKASKNDYAEVIVADIYMVCG